MQNSDYFLQLIKKIKPNISQNSLLQYHREISKIFKGIDNDNNMMESLSNDNLNKLIVSIEDKYKSDSTKSFKYNSIIILLKYFFGKDDDRYINLSELRDNYNNKYVEDKGKSTSKFISNEEYENVLNEMKQEAYEIMKKDKFTKNDFMTIQSYFLVYIFYYFPFRVDLTPMVILNKRDIPNNKEINYLQYYNRKWRFIFNVYKTSKTYGQNIVDVNDKNISKALTDYFNFLKKYNNQTTNIRLFSNKANNDFLLPSNMTNLFKEIFKIRLGKNFNITMNRRRFVSTNPILLQYKKVREEAEGIAHEMMHSVATQQNIYMTKT